MPLDREVDTPLGCRARRRPNGASGHHTARCADPPCTPATKISERPPLICAEPGKPVYHALTMVWPLVCRRLEGFRNMTSTQLFEELCIQFPGRFHPTHVDRLAKRVKVWRQHAGARGVVIGRLKNRRFSNKPRGRGPGPQRLLDHWPQMLQHLEAHPDITAAELLTEFQLTTKSERDRDGRREDGEIR
jgi:hypothetical protein